MRRSKFIPTLLSILFLGVGWQVISLSIGFPAIFPSLVDLLKEISGLFVSDHFYAELGTTILRGIIGFTFAFVFAFCCAVAALFSAFWKAFFHPIIVVTRSIPVISLVLIAILWFAPVQLPVFIALITMFPILYQNTLTGLEQCDYKNVEMAKLFGKSDYRRFVSIYLPASKASIFDGISTALGFGWRAIIIGEVLARPVHGIGTAMKEAQAYINVSELIAWTVVAIGISYLFEFVIKLIRRIKIKHQPSYAQSFELKAVDQTSELITIKVLNLEKKFNENTLCNYDDFSLSSDVINVLKGPSGSGKTTLLRLLSDLEKPDSGKIDKDALLSFACSFQDVRLLPWLTVLENIIYGMKPEDKHVAGDLSDFLLRKMELEDQRNKYPDELSGGQQQRVGLARALAAKSDVLLLDEALTGLDNELKKRITDFLSVWIKTYKPLVVWATHEQVEIEDLKITEIKL
jgi:ABC-type nitrate/sulfonate/bicarbonate transport system permease component/ABC-type nitrate/sulfonate/bicarbonate transport system ATPase subunit